MLLFSMLPWAARRRQRRGIDMSLKSSCCTPYFRASENNGSRNRNQKKADREPWYGEGICNLL